jgi:hypothetical protein
VPSFVFNNVSLNCVSLILLNSRDVGKNVRDRIIVPLVFDVMITSSTP